MGVQLNHFVDVLRHKQRGIGCHLLKETVSHQLHPTEAKYLIAMNGLKGRQQIVGFVIRKAVAQILSGVMPLCSASKSDTNRTKL